MSKVECPSQVTRRLECLLNEVTHLHPRAKRATHCMYAWRMTIPSDPPHATITSNARLKRSLTSIPASTIPTTRVVSGSVSGGESGAGERLERLLDMSVDCRGRDVVLIVYRWYGGVKLGSERWKCISSVAKEALGMAAEKEWK